MRKLLIIGLLLSLLIASCKSTTAPEPGEEAIGMVLSVEQFKSGNMSIGQPELTVFQKKIECKGKITTSVKGVALLSAPIQGIVKQIMVEKGNFVTKGDKIATIGGWGLIELQQQFMTSSGNLHQIKALYEKAKILYKENIQSESDFLVVERDYYAELAMYESLSQKLKSLGLSTENITDGNFVSEFALKAPIDGQISELYGLVGASVDQEHPIAKIVDSKKLLLDLMVFSKDGELLKLGQKVGFFTHNDKNNAGEATISKILPAMNSQTKTVHAIAKINNFGKNNLYIDQVVSGFVVTNNDTVFAIPEESVLTVGNSHYVLRIAKSNKDGYTLEKQQIQVGYVNEGWTQVLNGENLGDILVKGAYNFILE